MRSKQRGVFLIGATIAVAILGLLIAFWGRHQMQQMRIEKGERIGEALKVLGHHVQDFMVQHHGEIKTLFGGKDPRITLKIPAGEITLTRRFNGYFQATTIEDLTVDKLIRATGAKGIGASPPLSGAQYHIVVYSDNCADEKQPCDINAVTYLSAPIKSTYSTEPDWVASGAALTKLGALGGISRHDAPGTFRFLDGNGTVVNTVQNPAQPAVAGLLAMRGGYQTSAQDAFLRRDGTRAMTGDLNMAGPNGSKDIVGARNISATERVTASSVFATKNLVAGYSKDKHDELIKTMDGGVIAEGGIYSGKNVVAVGEVSADGDVHTKKSVRADVDVKAKGNVLAGGTLTANGATINGTLSVTGTGASVKLGEVTIGSDQRSMTVRNDVWGYGDVWAAGKLWSERGVIQLDGKVGGTCKERGIGLNADGRVMSCQNGTWQLGSAPKDPSEIPDDLREKIENGGRVGYVRWELVSGTFNAFKAFKPDCGSSTKVEVYNGFACQIDVLKNYCARPPQLVQRAQEHTTLTYELPAAGNEGGGIGGAVFSLTCLTRDAHSVMLKYMGGGNVAYTKLLDKSYAKRKAAAEMDLADLIASSRQPALAANVLIEKYRCWIGDGGETYNLDDEAGGPWDYCEMAADERKYHCDQPNQIRDLYRDANTGSWMMRIKQRSAGAKCIKFAR
ncbi:hypothetical protein PIN31115_00109 [Pandoraea iniqua]|uniref:Uncharacterized protein n=1 Tax=Pandoraea iniqua TaxID=2508288 RepID=A0A5E4RD57_9BURK|nr:hypothetical protein [Pandoraea iniqua]VVD61306.1 hypothetical protein PIN31115_00109 [Pandoraea iniqua]